MVPAGGGIQNLQQEAGTGLKMLMILSTVVLLIACANIANLMLARGTSRRADTAVRMAMGASRTRVMRHAITECVLLSCLGGLAGLAVAYAGSRMILALAFPDAHNLPVSASPSLAILGFAFAISLMTGVLFGLAPAWLASHAQPAEALRGVNRSLRDRSSLPQKLLVVLQAALSIVLIAGAILMTKSLDRLEKQDFGWRPAIVIVLHIDPEGAGYTVDRLPALYRSIEDRFSSLPGVAHMALAMYSPLEGDNWGECVIQQGHPAPGPNDHCGSTWVRVSPQYLASIGVPIVHGRDLSDQDTATSEPVAVVNQTFVKRFFPKVDPIGQHFGIDDPKYSGSLQDRGRVPRLQDEQPARSGAAGVPAADFRSTLQRTRSRDVYLDGESVDVRECNHHRLFQEPGEHRIPAEKYAGIHRSESHGGGSADVRRADCGQL